MKGRISKKLRNILNDAHARVQLQDALRNEDKVINHDGKIYSIRRMLDRITKHI